MESSQEWYRNGNWVAISRSDGIWIQNSLGTICVVQYDNYQTAIRAEDAAVYITDMLAKADESGWAHGDEP